MRPADLATDLFDLVLARACQWCDEPGRVLCGDCLEGCRGQVRRLSLPSGLTAAAALPYEEGGRDLVLSYKEHGTRALSPMLGVLLADAVVEAAGSGRHPLLLVPVPAHRRSRRGFDALGGIARHAAVDLRRRGVPTRLVRAVRSGRAYAPLKSLGRADRRQAVMQAFRVDRPVAGAVARSGLPVLVVDDIVTTGATLDAVIRLLTEAGVAVVGAAAVSAVSPGTRGPSPAPAPPTRPP